MSQKVKREIAASFLCILLLIVATGCNKGPYGFVTVLDHSVFDGQVYVLLLLEEGVNKAYRYAPHGDVFEVKRQLVAIARCSLSEKGIPSLELVSHREYRNGAMLKNYELYLAATNAWLASSAGLIEVVFSKSPQDAEHSQRLDAERTFFSAGRRLLIGCGKEPLVLDTRTFAGATNVDQVESLRPICGSMTSGNSVAASDDLSLVAIQDALASEPGLIVMTHGRTNQIRLPDATFRLQSVHGREGIGNVIFTSLDTNGRNVAVVLDLSGKELGRSDLVGEPASNPSGTIVVSISPMSATRSNRGEQMSVKVWLPKEHRDYVLSLNTTAILSTLKFSE
jgi:hypothetical protein